MRSGIGDGNGPPAALDIICTERLWRRKSPRERSDAQERFALFAEISLASNGGAAGFVIEQDRLDHLLQVAADSIAVVIEFPHHPIEIFAAGMTGDEPLDKL